MGSGPDGRDEERRALLRKEPWGQIQMRLTAIALKRLRRRSIEDAKDFAQSAIADAYQSIEAGGWDPAKGPLLSFLVARLISRTENERRRKRNACEVWLDEEVDDEDGAILRHEKHTGDGKPTAEDALSRLRFAQTFHDRLVARFAGDEPVLAAVALMKEGIAKPQELARKARRPVAEMKMALRRIRYQALVITQELSAANVVPLGRARAKEVVQ